MNLISRIWLCVAIFSTFGIMATQVLFQPPVDFKPKLQVATCYLICDGEVLFLKRCATSTWAYTWGPPGGKIEVYQVPMQAAMQEVLEETGIELVPEKVIFLQKVYVRDAQKDFVYYMFKCELDCKPSEIKLAVDEHINYKWLTPAQALDELVLIPGEDECLKMIFGP